MKNIPLDGESGNAGLLSQHNAADLFNHGFGRWIVIQLLRLVLVVNIIADTDEFTTIVSTCEENDSNAEDLVNRDALRVRRVGLEDKLVDAYRDGPDEQRVELLVVVI